MTDREIRQYVTTADTIRVRIARDGSVHRYTNQPRGDGGQTPWWQYVGERDELAQEIEASRIE